MGNKVFINFESGTAPAVVKAVAQVLLTCPFPNRNQVATINGIRFYCLEVRDTEPRDLAVLCNQLRLVANQDCVSIYNPENGFGALFGYRTAVYGPFETAKFWIPGEWQ
jgi:hypothetical protein